MATKLKVELEKENKAYAEQVKQLQEALTQAQEKSNQLKQEYEAQVKQLEQVRPALIEATKQVEHLQQELEAVSTAEGFIQRFVALPKEQAVKLHFLAKQDMQAYQLTRALIYGQI